MKDICRFLRFLVAIGSMSGRNVREKLLHLHGLQLHVCRHQSHGQAHLICGVGKLVGLTEIMAHNQGTKQHEKKNGSKTQPKPGCNFKLHFAPP